MPYCVYYTEKRTRKSWCANGKKEALSEARKLRKKRKKNVQVWWLAPGFRRGSHIVKERR